jgi:hypothetical protein
MVRVRSVHNSGNLVSHTLVFSPDKPVSVLFDACVAIDQGGCGGIGCGCGGLAWERACTYNDKYIHIYVYIYTMTSICAEETTLGHVMM